MTKHPALTHTRHAMASQPLTAPASVAAATALLLMAGAACEPTHRPDPTSASGAPHALDRTEPAGVIEVSPSASTVPENLLRMHVHFATAMAEGWAHRHIHLADDQGQVIADALLDPVRELWDRERRQLTIILDPARVKTGLIAHEKLGRALVAGHSYRLVVTPGWPTLDGGQLTTTFEHHFTAGPADRISPQPETWTITAPAAGTRTAVSVHLPEPLDRVSMGAFIRVVDERGKPLAGDIRLARDDREWRFVPRRPWTAGTYQLAVAGRLEDLAGNNLFEAFDHPIGAGSSAGQDGRTFNQPFAVGKI